MAVPINVIFVCTHNACRSIIAEATARHLGQGKIIAASVGSAPSGKINSDALSLLRSQQIPIEGLRSKSWDALAHFNADVIITVCDQAAQEACPVSQQKIQHVHWGLSDPSLINDTPKHRKQAFEETYAQIQQLVEELLTLDLSEHDHISSRHGPEQPAQMSKRSIAKLVQRLQAAAPNTNRVLAPYSHTRIL